MGLLFRRRAGQLPNWLYEGRKAGNFSRAQRGALAGIPLEPPSTTRPALGFGAHKRLQPCTRSQGSGAKGSPGGAEPASALCPRQLPAFPTASSLKKQAKIVVEQAHS